jgi:16S rRNA pseudouridine516 synthase
MTDDGKLLHRIVAPKTHLPKIYEVTLARDLKGTETAIFASGTLMLESERTPLRPATLEITNPRTARVTLTEGRYHQVRRMFAAVGNHVETLHRSQVGGLTLGALSPGEWRTLSATDVASVFERLPG